MVNVIYYVYSHSLPPSLLSFHFPNPQFPFQSFWRRCCIMTQKSFPSLPAPHTMVFPPTRTGRKKIRGLSEVLLRAWETIFYANQSCLFKMHHDLSFHKYQSTSQTEESTWSPGRTRKNINIFVI